MIEPVFGQTKFNRGDRPLPTPRHEPPCRTEWRLITATHNLRG